MTETHFLKFYLYILTAVVIGIAGCAGAEKQQAPVTAKKPVVDSSIAGMENLKKSVVMRDIICQEWSSKEDVFNAKELDITSDFEIPYRGFCFFQDGTVIKDPRGYLKAGKWLLNEAQKPITISMEFDRGGKEIYQLAYLAPFEMILATNEGTAKQTTDFSAEGRRHININEDPFYRDNILWRIKPLVSENDQAIRKRLKDCIHFFVLFYEQMIHARSETVTFVGLPTCFIWYSGGVSLQSEEDLQEKWISCFYNKNEAMKAYRLAGKLLREKYDLPKRETNWLRANLAILKKMEARIDQLTIDR